MQKSFLKTKISVITGCIWLSVLALVQQTFEKNDCLLFTFDKEMNILTECCLTHCNLHHHYLVNKSALLVFRTARYCEVSFYLGTRF